MAENNPLGYSGSAVYLRTSNGVVGEIQVNTPEMIYGKGPPEYAQMVLGEQKFNQIAQSSGVKSGLGHEYYENWRQLNSDDPKRIAIALESQSYYQSIRNSK